MTWRKWLVRGLVFSVLGSILLAGLLYQAWTNPAATRRRLLDKLGLRFAGAAVSIESAHLRLFGGIAVSELRMARRDDLDRTDFLYVPSAVIYHDKEHLLEGKVGIRKVELDRPRLRVIREHDGRWNLAGLLRPPPEGERMPTVVIKRGTILLEDRTAPPGTPLLEINDVSLRAINDPLPVVTVEGSGQTDVAGPVRISARIQQPTRLLTARVELPAVPVGPALVQRLAGPFPELAGHLRQLTGTAAVQAALCRHPGSPRPLTYDVTCRLTRGELSHARLPLPLEQIDASVHCVNGAVPDARLTARAGSARLELSLKDLTVPVQPPSCPEDLVRELDARVEHLDVTESLFDYLPKQCRETLRKPYKPTGPASLTYAFRRTGQDRWREHWNIQAEGMQGEFHEFQYGLDGITGTVEVETTSDHDNAIKVDVAGQASGQPVTLRGTVRGPKATSAVDLVLQGKNIPLDGKLYNALRPKYQQVARQFLPQKSLDLGLDAHPLGLGDVQAFIRRERGQNTFANRYVITFHDAAVKYDLFPYPLDNVTAVLDLQPDHWECRDFRGTHRGGEMRVNARSYRLPGPPARGSASAPAEPEEENPPVTAPRRDRVRVEIHGRDILLDNDFVEALAPPGMTGRVPLQRAWRMLALQGRLGFSAVVIDHPDPPQDIDVGVTIRNCTMQPAFFPYALSRVSGRVRYARDPVTGRDQVFLHDVQAHHGAGTLSLGTGPRPALIRLTPGGGFQAWLFPVKCTNLVPDRDLLKALPHALRSGIAPLHLRQPLDVETKLTLEVPAEGKDLKVWWDGRADLHNATARVGIDLSGLNGQIACRGHYNGQQLKRLTGGFLFEEATLLGQPCRKLGGRVEVAPDSPEVLRLRDLRASLFGGDLGGEARLEFGPRLQYELDVKALKLQLEQFGRHNLGPDPQLEGAASADLHLLGEGADLGGLKGDGRLDVPHGKMYRLPLLLHLLKAFGLRVPDRTAFEEAHVQFKIEGPQARIDKLDLIGNAISLRGQGTLNLDGSNVNLDFNADWSRFPQMLPEGISAIPRAISDQILKIKMRGKIGKDGKVRFEKELMPAVVEPIKRAFGSSP